MHATSQQGPEPASSVLWPLVGLGRGYLWPSSRQSRPGADRASGRPRNSCLPARRSTTLSRTPGSARRLPASPHPSRPPPSPLTASLSPPPRRPTDHALARLPPATGRSQAARAQRHIRWAASQPPRGHTARPQRPATGQPPGPSGPCPCWLLVAGLQLHTTGCCRVFGFWIEGF